MSRSPFASLTIGKGRTFAVHHSAVICVEQIVEGTYILVRVGNSADLYEVDTPYEEVMRELERARRAEIVSFGE